MRSTGFEPKRGTVTNFSTSVNRQTRAKVLHEVRPLLDAQTKCKALWQALMLADYKKEGTLNSAALQIFLDSQRENLREMLLVRSVDDLLELLDEDEDGFLNEDEQILLFSAIKERMQNLANELCTIHEYALYKDMMSAIRLLERDIIHYQNILRERTHKKELKVYDDIGQDKLKDFNIDWRKNFEDFRLECDKRFEELRSLHADQMQTLNEKLTNEVIKIKPKPVLRELQVQEKLLAVNERYYEAQQIRNELKVMEETEQNRVEQQIVESQELKRKALLKQQEKEMRQMDIKNKTNYNKLMIKMQQDRARLQKEIKLHYHDITKNQNLAKKYGEKLGTTRDELRRVKLKSKRLQEYLKDAKEAKNRNKSLDPGNQPMTAPSRTQRSGVMSAVSTTFGFKAANPLKNSIKDTTKFNIQSDITNDRPVNVVPDFMGSSSFSAKTSKILSQSRKEQTTLPPLTALYNTMLNSLEGDN